MTKPQVNIFVDGACDPNPGRGGYGVVLVSGNYTKEIAGPPGDVEINTTTSNRMEVLAAIKALEALRRSSEVQLHSDSNYLVNTMNGLYRFGSNVDLWEALQTISDEHDVEWIKLPRTDERLKRPHELANKGMRQQ